jgi:ABC transporter substrate binding protein
MAVTIGRRELLAALGGAAAAWPLAARAQQPERVRRVGVLLRVAQDDPDAQLDLQALRKGLKAAGWVVGHNIEVNYRYASADPDQMRAYAAELVGLPAEVILASGSLAVAALRRETNVLPIVFVRVGEPVDMGFVASLARPGNNVTGFTSFEYEIIGKWLGLLKDIAPHVDRVALMFNPTTAPSGPGFFRSFETVAPAFTVKPIGALIATPLRLRPQLATLNKEHAAVSLYFQTPLRTFIASRSLRLPHVIACRPYTATAISSLPAA